MRRVGSVQPRAMPRCMSCVLITIVVSVLFIAIRHRTVIEATYHQHRVLSPSIHTVRPSDIGIVAALGDSFTAAYQADNVHQIDSPEYSFSMGHKQNHVTIPSILRKFGASPIGASKSTADRGFNCAVSGQHSYHLISQIARLRHLLSIEATSTKWKLLTIFIGLNDMSRVCFGGESIEVVASEYKANLEVALKTLAKSMNRTIVSIVSVPDVRTVRIKPHLNMTCSEKESRRLGQVLNAHMEAIVAEGSLERDDFTVVQQPLFSGASEPPKLRSGSVDTTLFSPDLFHPSIKGHTMYAVALWNNMLEPVGAKSSTYLEEPFQIHSPSEECPYIRTRKNSISCHFP